MEINGQPLYHFSCSQDVIRLQNKYALFKRVLNILFSVTFDEGFDEALMTQALNKLFERHDCLRLRFVQQGKETMQYFEKERKVGKIPSLRLDSNDAYEAFFRRFRRKPTDVAKGDVLRVVYAVNPDGKKMVICKISHYVADTYGIGVLVADLLAVYAALRKSSARTTNTATMRRPWSATETSTATTTSTVILSTLSTAARTATAPTAGSSTSTRANSDCPTSSSAATPTPSSSPSRIRSPRLRRSGARTTASP